MSQQAGYSPSFKRPAEIMRMRRKRARSDAGAPSGPSGQRVPAGRTEESDSPSPLSVRSFSPGPLLRAQNRSGGVKRRNPFANIDNTYNPKKKSLRRDGDGDRDRDGDASAKPSEREGDGDAFVEPTGREGEGDGDGDGGARRGALPFGARLSEVEKREHRDAFSKKCLDFNKDDSRAEDEDEEGEEEDVKSLLLKSPPAPIAPASIAPPACTRYPADWSLKTRVLFTSPLSLLWAEQPKAQEEAAGLSRHCRAQFDPLPHSVQDPRACPELRCAFQQSLVYWQHPSLPWIRLFPRINAERSFAGKNAPWAQDPALQRSLMSEWSVSLSSLYSLLKARLCPYFYLCSYQFTVLFRAAGLGGSGNITALISPTTRGLREAMKAEGIEFSLPLAEERKANRERHQGGGGGEEEEEKEEEEEQQREEEQKRCSEPKGGEKCGSDDDEDGSFSWLKEMGVEDKVKKPDSITIQLRREGHAVSLDHKPESVVRVEAAHTFTLINFLINCKSAVAAAGSQAGLPPTLLAPVAFRGAAMHALKARSVNVKSQVGSTYQNISSLEITGPVLPSSLHALTALLRPAQKGNFSAALYTHTPTAVMNTATTEQQQRTGPPADLHGCGLHPATVQQLQQPSSLGKGALTHINMSNHSYTWKI